MLQDADNNMPKKWNAPENLKDNTIVTVSYWNSILGTDGSVEYLDDLTNARAMCNTYTADFNVNVAIRGSGATSATRITKFTRTSNSNIFDIKTGAMQFPSNVPLLMLWSCSISETVATGYHFRSSIELDKKIAKGVQKSTVANFITRKDVAAETKLSASYAMISGADYNKYYITFNHGHTSSMTVSGRMVVIVNPAMV